MAGPSAARALGTVDSGTAAPHLREALSDETLAPRTRAAAAAAIGTAGRWDAVWLLLSLLDDPDDEIRAGVLDGLETRVENGLRPWERHPVAWALAESLATDEKHIWRTRNALDGLAQALPEVRRLADNAPSGEVLAAALSLLDPDAPDDEHTRHDPRRFLRGLDDPHEAVRYQAVLGLRRWAEATGSLPPDRGRTRDRLTGLTEDASPRLRQAATRLLGSADSGPP
ncbi:HEAT repeat domain-containing protein [Streptomyces massasporeus]|uniref:HEAT repeat domain-containing protein n=1 Tax=Streptomyces massasporeus TaxID=67324 RepID=UPI0033AA8543